MGNFNFDTDLKSSTDVLGSPTQMYSHNWEVELLCHKTAHHWNRPFSKMATENLNKLKLANIKKYTSTRKNTFTLVTLQSFIISGVIPAEKM